jgi:phospholipid/cholesterol/gamma-HCH transport system ATP-binding protein
MNVIEVKDIITQFGSKIVHNKVSFSVKENEIFAILGASGSGKTVLLKEIIMLLKPTSGQIKVLGKDISKISYKEALEIKKSWGVLFQFGALFTSLNVAQNIALPLKEYTNLPKDIIDDIVISKLKLVGLSANVASLFPSELSGGMIKRVALARALAMDPKLLFLDEPTSGLDPVGARNFDKLIVKLKESLGITVVMITHDLDSIFSIVNNMVILADAKVVAKGTIKDVLKSNHPFVEAFFKNEYVKKRYLGKEDV